MERGSRKPLPKIDSDQNVANDVMKETTHTIVTDPEFVASPRGMEVREILNADYTVPMPAYQDLKDRKVNVPFMFSEGAWVVSGSNSASEISEYMSGYRNYSDDGITMNGAYGPKVVDQLAYIASSLEADPSSRQAYLNIWRERPSASKDIPCTVGMQFFIRDDHLYMRSTMRSNDAVFGQTYDIFTFSMVATAVQLLLKDRGIDVELGDLTITAGSFHVYEKHYEQVEEWQASTERDRSIKQMVDWVMHATTYPDLIKRLKTAAKDYKKNNNA